MHNLIKNVSNIHCKVKRINIDIELKIMNSVLQQWLHVAGLLRARLGEAVVSTVGCV